MRLKWLLPLLLLFCAPHSRAQNLPQPISQCYVNNEAAFTATKNCTLPSTTSGDVVVVFIVAFSNTYTITSTETLTCPTNAKTQHVYFGATNTSIATCYVATTSSHSPFNISLAGVDDRGLIVWAASYPAYGGWTLDTGASSAANAATVNFTTAGSNEVAFCMAWDDTGTPPTYGNSFAQINRTTFDDLNSGDKAFEMVKFIAASGSNTCSYTNGNHSEISVIAFTIASVTTPAAPRIVQSCFFNIQGSGLHQCLLQNTTVGNKIVAVASLWGPSVINGNSATETMSVATYTSTIYGGNTTGLGILYVDTVSSHASFSVAVTCSTGCTGADDLVIHGYEISGAASGLEATANALALTTSYTTAVNNDFVVMGCFDKTNVLTPGNGFISREYSYISPNVSNGPDTELVSASQTVAASGSQTASCSMTGSSQPLIAVAVFGPTSPTNVPRKKGWIGE